MAENTLSGTSLSTRWSLCSSVDKWRDAQGVETHSARVVDKKDAAPARSDNELCVGGVNPAFTVEMTVSHSFGQSNYE